MARGYREVESLYPAAGWVEQDALEIWRTVVEASSEAMAAAPDCVPVAIGVANQRETFLFWDRRSGEPLHKAIVWQCRRSSEICEEMRASGIEPEIARKTGLRLDPYFSGSKVLWLRRNDVSLAARIDGGEALFGTIDAWLAWRLSGGAAFVTDTTNASRTLCFDIDAFDWDDGLLATFGLNRGVMPEVGPPASVRGVTRGAGFVADGTPIAALVGDQQAALYGQACFAPGLMKATYGTGSFILLHTGSEPVFSDRGLLTTVAATANGSKAYALEGSVFIAGAAFQWCRDNLGLFATYEEGEALANSVPDSGGVVFVPAFAGLGSPHWAPDVRGAIYGLTGATTPAQIVRAALESMIYQTQDVLEVMGGAAVELRVDGGSAGNAMLMQLQADLSGLPVSRPASVDSTALGAAFLAGLAVGFWRDESEVASLRVEERRFVPSGGASAARVGYGRWRAAVAGLLGTGL